MNKFLELEKEAQVKMIKTIGKAFKNRKSIKGAEQMLQHHAKFIQENAHNLEAVKNRTNVIKSVESQRRNIQNQMGNTGLAKKIKGRQDARLERIMAELNPASNTATKATKAKTPDTFQVSKEDKDLLDKVRAAATDGTKDKGSIARPLTAGAILGAGGYHIYNGSKEQNPYQMKYAAVSDLVKATKELVPNLKKLIKKTQVGHYDTFNTATGPIPKYKREFVNDPKVMKEIGKGLILPGAATAAASIYYPATRDARKQLAADMVVF